MHVLRLKLIPNKGQKYFLNKSFSIAYRIYVCLIKYVWKKTRLLSKNNRYIYLKHMYGIYKNEKNNLKLKEISAELNSIIKSYKISKYDLEKYIKSMQHKYRTYITSHQVQKIVNFVSKSVDDFLYGNGKKIRLKKYTEFNIISQKNSTNGIKFRGNYIELLGHIIPVKYSNNKKDLEYITLSLEKWEDNLKYCELIKIEFNSGTDFYINLVLDGEAPSKVTKGKNTCGIDPGVSTIAYTSDNKCILKELAPKCKNYNKEIIKLQRQIDQSVRATNKDNFNSDGTIKKGTKFVYTNHCKYLKKKLRVLYRQRKAYTKCTHLNLINELLEGMGKVNIEDMNFKSLAKRTKITERSETKTIVKQKDGLLKEVQKYKKKKRFGKSINDRSPGLFIKLLETKCNKLNIEFNKINTSKVKASQYNHIEDKYIKYKLSDRIKLIGTDIVQRDLYSAYIIKHVKSDLETLNKKALKKNFKQFVNLQNKEIENIKQKGIKNKNFGF